MGGVLRVPQVVQREVGRDDQRLAAAAVSYTHLDVYKRQAGNGVPSAGRPLSPNPTGENQVTYLQVGDGAAVRARLGVDFTAQAQGTLPGFVARPRCV